MEIVAAHAPMPWFKVHPKNFSQLGKRPIWAMFGRRPSAGLATVAVEKKAGEDNAMDNWDFLKWRRTLRYKQTEAAKGLGVNRATIQNWERGVMRIPISRRIGLRGTHATMEATARVRPRETRLCGHFDIAAV